MMLLLCRVFCNATLLIISDDSNCQSVLNILHEYRNNKTTLANPNACHMPTTPLSRPYVNKNTRGMQTQ